MTEALFANDRDAESEIRRLRQELSELRSKLAGESRTSRADREDMWRVAYEQAPHPIVLLDPNGTVQYANPPAREVISGGPEPLTGRPFWQLGSNLRFPEEAAKMRDAAARAARGERAQCEIIHSGPDGLVRPLRISIWPVQDDRERVIAIIAEAWEFDDAQHVVEKLRQTVNEQRTILDTLSAGVCMMKHDEVVWLNPACTAITGYTAETLRGQETRFFHANPDDYDRSRSEGIERATACGCYATELQARRKNGEVFWCSVSGCPMDPQDVEAGIVWVLQDVTERHDAVEALKLSEARLEVAQAQARIGSWEIGPNQETMFWSKEMFALLGFDHNAPIPPLSDFLEAVHPEDRERVGAIHDLAAVSQAPQIVEYRTNPARGPIKHLCATVEAVRGPADRIAKIMGTLQDITERKQAEESLRLSQARLESAQAQAHIGNWEFIPDAHSVYWSKEMYQLLGWDPSLPVRPSIEHVDDVAPTGKAEILHMFHRALASVEQQSAEFCSHPSQGPVRYFCATCEGIRDPSGKLLRVAGTLQDITELKRADMAVREGEKRLERLVQNSKDIIAVVDGKGIPMSFHGPVVSMLGHRAEALTGIHPRELVHPDDLAPTLQRLSDVSSRPGATQRFDVRLKHQDGRWIATEVVATNWLHDPGINGIVLNIRDITDRKNAESDRTRLEEQLQQAIKMEAVGRLAGGVAHDFNNLLTVIFGNLELARRDIQRADPLDQYLAEVASAASSAAELTRQLLAFSRRQIIEPKVLNLNALIGNLSKMLKRLIGEDIALSTSLASDLGSVKVDPGQFDQVVVNLAVNARDAMPHGGELVIATANVDLDHAYCQLHPDLSPGSHVVLTVSDTGHGMTLEARRRVFEPFFTTKAKGRGTGLGLAMIFGIVKQSGGTIDVYSEVGHGTTFKIFLPRIDEQPESVAPTMASVDLPRGHETILLVEDEASVRNLSARFLKRQGYDVLVAQNGGEAFLIAEKRTTPIDLLLIDVVLPGMSGRELSERLRPLHPEAAVLFTSGYTDDMIVRHGILEENLYFIGKPYSLQAIARKVRTVLDERATHKP